MNLQIQNCVDRFIPLRSQLNIDCAHYLITTSDSGDEPKTKQNDIFEPNMNYWNEFKYRQTLCRQLTLIPAKVLYFSEPKFEKSFELERRRSDLFTVIGGDSKTGWPVIARKKPMTSLSRCFSGTNLDFSNFYICDWGNKDLFACITATGLYVGYFKKRPAEWKCVYKNHVSYGNPSVAQWNSQGNCIAIGTITGQCIIKDLKKSEEYKIDHCTCFYQSSPNSSRPECEITAIRWDKLDIYLITGCTRGSLTLFDAHTHKIHTGIHRVHQNYVVHLKLNSNGNMLASTGHGGHVVIWKFPSLEQHHTVQFGYEIVGVDFHPWCPSIIVFGGGKHGKTLLWNIETCKVISMYVTERAKFVDFLAWNKLTGELVASYLTNIHTENDSVMAEENSTVSTLVILSALDTAVELIKLDKRIVGILWNPDGTQLAVYDSGLTNVTVFDFLGQDRKVHEWLKSRRGVHSSEKLNATLPSLRHTIR